MMKKFSKSLKRNKWIVFVIVIVAIVAVPVLTKSKEEKVPMSLPGLSTNTAKSSIDLNKILSGGPGKDGIPALTNPKFENINDSKISDNQDGILVRIGGDVRFYPLNILVWHEVVNDVVGGKEIAVTFCPLCGSAIVFDRSVEGEVLQFGVSGLLFESNLLMYDKSTESLWSQARGEAVVGQYSGEKLTVLPMQQINFGHVKKNYPSAKVLSENTGHFRDYQRNPYSGYEETEELIFPVTVTDNRFLAKEIMFVFPYKEKSYAFPNLELGEGEVSDFKHTGTNFTAKRVGGEITITADGKEIPGYFEMWFSWATHHQEDGVVWDM